MLPSPETSSTLKSLSPQSWCGMSSAPQAAAATTSAAVFEQQPSLHPLPRNFEALLPVVRTEPHEYQDEFAPEALNDKYVGAV
mmetsp:Transcript_68895/g.150585  ORF Transcript_68895/g.150585 Transcript_68895/m.150585 type:complete len:83 (+) Transcript_68895:2772-3020(+)